MYRNKTKETFYFTLALVLGAFMAVGVSVWATSIGTNISSSGSLSAATTLSATGRSTLSGGILVNNATSTITWLDMLNATSTNATSTYLGVTTHASTSALTVSNLSTLRGGILSNFSTSTITWLDMLNSTSTQATSTSLAVTSHASTSALRVSNGVTFDGLSFTYTNVSTTTIATNANAHAYATSSASIPLLKLDASNTRVGIGTTTPGATFAVGGDGYAIISGNGTSTLSIQSTDLGTGVNTRGGCIELEAADGNGRVAIYASIAATTTLIVQSGGCR